MKLISLTLLNFRQFYGSQSIHFENEEGGNVIVIHGENGSGKTALLNAFKWAFYGTTDFETGNDNLLSERLRAETDENEDMEMSVVVVFEHDEVKYSVMRSQFYQKKEALDYKSIGPSKVNLSWTDESGVYKESPNATTHINQILPSRMHPYFFFNGERIEKLSNIESSPDIQRAIKGMMGIEIIERAERHLSNYVIKSFKKELKTLSTEDLSNAIEKENFYTERVEEAKKEIAHHKSEKRHQQTLLSDINNKLKEIGPISELQNEREQLNKDIDGINESIYSVKKEKLQYVSKLGYLAVAKNIITEADQILEDKRSKGELPSKIKEQFLNDLLDSEQCICGRSLIINSSEYHYVQNLKKQAVPNDVESAFIETSGDVKGMQNARKKLFEDLQTFRKRISEYEELKKNKHGRIDEISESIGNSDIEDVVSLENKREEVRGVVSKIDQQIGKWDNKLKEAEDELNEWSKTRKEIDKKGGEASVVNERLELAEEVKRVLEELHKALSENVRIELSEIVNNTFRTIIKKEYWAEIDEDYTLQIKKKIGEHVQNVIDKSTGESQVSSLSFIGGLVSLAKQRHGRTGEYYRGGIFPIVMDSPYGNLDPEYKEKVANYIPKLAEQIVIMVSNSQWKEKVKDAVSGRVVREYTLMYHTPHKKEDTITSSVIGGEKYEYTEIKEGYYE